MIRYFIRLAYNGTNYAGWQRQPNAPSVQQTLEEALSLILRQQIRITGCGRTDAGVHAKQYTAHFDAQGDLPPGLGSRLNKFLPADIVIYDITPVADAAHARFDAVHRAYEYRLTFQKNPFQRDTVWRYPAAGRPDLAKLNEAAELLLSYTEFFPFCKSNNDAKTMICTLYRSEWVAVPEDNEYIFYIAANRFLRGMVRLIVGMCLNVAAGKITLNQVRDAMEKQERLPKDWSVGAGGLYLTDIRYDITE